MATAHSTLSTTMTTQRSRLNRTTAGILILEGLLLLLPVIILGGAINWPVSLDEPASVMLPLIQAQADAVRLGYFIYLIYSILFWPVSLLVTRVVADGDTYSPMLQLAVGFGIASAVLRTLGIIRWLFPMPVLAQLYTDPNTSAQSQEMITIVYQTLNEYAGSVGEVLGVSLFAAIWFVLISLVILRLGTLPRWLGIFGLVAALGLFSSILELFDVDLGAFITITVSVVQFWFLAAGGVLLFRKSGV